MQKNISISSLACAIHGQKVRMVIALLTLFFAGRCFGMQEDRQNYGTTFHKSCEQTACAACGILIGSCCDAVAGAGFYARDNCCWNRLGVFGEWPQGNFVCGTVIVAVSAACLNKPDHSCLCGRCRKIACAIIHRKNRAPSPMTMDGEKKDL